MTMDSMIKFLEERGFEAHKKYDPRARSYDFAVALPGRPVVHSDFKYPENCDPGEKDDLQRDFLHNLISGYHANFGCLGQPDPAYIIADIEATRTICNATRDALTIKDVIYNDPATIVFWMDGTKTVVKCDERDFYDAEKGLAMAISKKALGNKGNYCNVFKKWLPKVEEEVDSLYPKLMLDGFGMSEAAAAFSKLADELIAARKQMRNT